MTQNESNSPHPSDGTVTPEQADVIGAGAPDAGSGLVKDPEAWATADEPMTGAQRSYLDTLAREAGETLPAELTKAEASQHIDRLQQKSSRLGDDG